MSFKNLQDDELRLAATAFGIEVDEAVPAEVIADMLDAEGATFARWQEMKKFSGLDEPVVEVVEVEPEPEPVVVVAKKRKAKPVVPDEVVVKMERNNQRFEAYGKVFTKEHPYVLCDVNTANEIFSHFDGFRMAQPREIESFYA